MQDGCHLEKLPICYNRCMILVTGGTGFIGSRIVLRLVQSRFPLKILLRPKKIITQLPHNFALDVVVSSLNDQRSLRAVLSGVDTVLHFASSEHEKPNPDFDTVDIKGTNTLVKASIDASLVTMSSCLSRLSRVAKPWTVLFSTSTLLRGIDKLILLSCRDTLVSYNFFS